MTFADLEKNNSSLIDRYLQALCTLELSKYQSLQLTSEINRLQNHNDFIGRMSVYDYRKPCETYTIKKQSIINGISN